MIEVREYVDSDGRSSFAKWFASLNVTAAAKVTVALERIAVGHTSSLKALGGGLMEYKIDFGPGYRIYLARDGDRLIILLGGGTKKRQQRDIEEAKRLWSLYKLQSKENRSWH